MVLFPVYCTCSPSQYLAVSGCGIDGTMVCKKKWIYPGQQYRRLDVSPQNYEFDIQAMSSEKLPFTLPVVFTIGPKLEMENLTLFAQLLATHDPNGNHVTTIIKGIVEGETRVLAASLTMNKIFEGTREFKEEIYDKVQTELNQFGLKIYNANIKQLVDLPGHEYFSYLGQKTQKDAANQAKVDIALANNKGEVGARQQEGETKRKVCEINNQTRMFEIEQNTVTEKKQAEKQAEVVIKQNEATAEVAINKSKLDEKTRIAAIEAEKMAQIRQANLEMELNQKQAKATTEKYRADSYSKAVVEAEIVNKQADAEFYKKKLEADANFYAKQRDLDAYLLQKEKEAQAVTLVARAQATAVEQMLKAFDGNAHMYVTWKALEDKLLEKLATCNAEAVRGLNPNVSVWNTGSQPGDAGKAITDLCQMIPPMFSTIEQQTGMQLLPSLVAKSNVNTADKRALVANQ